MILFTIFFFFAGPPIDNFNGTIDNKPVMEFLAETGITQLDLMNIIAIVVVLLVVLALVRVVFRVTRSIFRMGCAIIFLVAGILLLLSYLNGRR